jgi:hypothetical protein
MNRTAIRSAAVYVGAAIALVVLVVIVAANLGRAVAADAPPSAAPSPTPTPIVTPTPVVNPSPQPSAPTGGKFEFDLDVATPDEVSVLAEDELGFVTGASSGRAGDGMSVRWGMVKVENVDDNTLRVTWVGLPGDVVIKVVIAGTADRPLILIAQPEPPENSDALGHDRVLVLDFSTPIRAADVEAHVQEGFDTAG